MSNYNYYWKLLLIKIIVLGIIPPLIIPSKALSQEVETLENENTSEIKPQEDQSLPTKPEKNRTFDYFEPIPEGFQVKPFGEESSDQFNAYRLDFGDTVSVVVQRFPEFDFTAILDAQGTVVAPLIGRISLRGLTLEEVETKISYEIGKRFLQEEPQVIAVIAGERPVSLTLIGEVFKPGYYTLAQNTPLSVILTTAGGTTDQADLRSIIIKRTLVDGTVIEEKVDLYTPLIEGKKEPRLKLQAGDTVIVSKLQIGEERDYDRYFISRTNVPVQSITVRVISPVGRTQAQMRNVILPNGSSFLDAVAQLPAVEPLVTKDQVTLMRFDPELGRVVTQTLNVVDTVEKGDLTQDVLLRDQDVIIVSRTVLGRVLAGFEIITRPIRDVLGFVTYFNNLSDIFDDDR